MPSERRSSNHGPSFLRWAGSKRKSLGILSSAFSDTSRQYVEPFAGSAALFFSLQPDSGLLGDLKALNAGAIIHVPHPESGPDTLLRGLRGQRFRLSYALASRYRLLLTLGDRVSLSKLLLEMRGVDIRNAQQTLFDTSGQNGDS